MKLHKLKRQLQIALRNDDWEEAVLAAMKIYRVLSDSPYGFSVITGRWSTRASSKNFHVWLQEHGIHLGGEQASEFPRAMLAVLESPKLKKKIAEKEAGRKPAKVAKHSTAKKSRKVAKRKK